VIYKIETPHTNSLGHKHRDAPTNHAFRRWRSLCLPASGVSLRLSLLLCFPLLFFVFWASSQSSCSFNRISLFHGAPISRDKVRKSSTFLLMFALLSLSSSKWTSETSLPSSGVLLNNSGFRFLALPNYSRSVSNPPHLEAPPY